MNCEKIKQMIEAGLPNCQATVKSGDNVHFDAVVVSAEFEGKSLLARQRLVYATLGDHLRNGDIHALSLKTQLP